MIEHLRHFNSSLKSKAIDEENYTISFIALSKENLHKRSFIDDFYLSVDTSKVEFKAKTFYTDHEVSFNSAIGNIIDFKNENGDLKVKVQFYPEIKESKEAFYKYKNGLSDSVSVGFEDAEIKELEPFEGLKHYQIQSGVINELSAVWQGADPNAKISVFHKQINQNLTPKETPMNQKEINQSQEKELSTPNIIIKENDSIELAKMKEVYKNDEVLNIIELGKICNAEKEALNAIENGISFKEFSKSLREEHKEFNQSRKSNTSFKKDDFSLANLVLNASNQSIDISNELSFAKDGGKFVIPNSFYDKFSDSVNKSSNESIQTIIPQVYRNDKFIDMVFAESNFLSQCDIMSGLVGKQEIPKDETAFDAYFVEEGGTSDAQIAGFSSFVLSPHTINAVSIITRTMLHMTPIALESFIINKLKQAIRRKLETSCLYGDGVSEPIKGVFNTDGINVISGYFKDLDRAKTLEFVTKLKEQDFDISSVLFMANAISMTKLQTTRPDAQDVTKYLLNDNANSLCGYSFLMNNRFKDDHILFGNFKNILIGAWGNGLEVKFLPVRGGNTIIEGFYDVDMKVKEAKRLVIAKD